MESERRPPPFRIMTYNIHKAIGGVDRRYDLSRVVETVAHYQPDVLFLQEVDDGVPRSKLDFQAQLLAEELKYPHSVFQPNIRLKRGQYGNAILSRFPCRETWNVDLKISFKKRRRALIVKTMLGNGSMACPIWLCNVHLGLSGFERTMQLKRLLHCQPINRIRAGNALIVGGDFNDVWTTLGRKVMRPQGFQSALPKAKTFPALLPVRSLDALYFRGTLSLSTAFVGRTKSARAASDHLPLIADFETGAVD